MFDQSPYTCRLEWGKRGAREARERGDIVIVVDVFSFSSTVVSALHQGAIIYPYPPELDGKAYAYQVGATYILGRKEAVNANQPTLSPVTFQSTHQEQKFVLSSLNGAVCSWIAAKVPALLIGCLLNADAVANAAHKLHSKYQRNITVIPCGERWNDSKSGEDHLRPSVEDYLGAGAILSRLSGTKSPEAEVCASAFGGISHKIRDLIWNCGSGRELRLRGYDKDVEHCSQWNMYDTVPILQDGRFKKNQLHD
ncbi:2-phosphosulfolactate phosphatase [Salirhabdus euzebyi]|uniref:Probable 2-phosphosulfolactate phosphatase n=1 Tax=Salirhabdus euzebyi TaxID=394506 RepID=A0A841Q4C7_9BACI|nr:2-phosphosulfolactate phosphatase [Salirhabdus euzebyi]MBB6453279.1 2-phosphosulfolactate phosphatase [Salirhabdus euzebyi]